MPAILGLLGIFLVVVGARWWLIASFGSPTPVLDQWNGEAAAVYLPYLGGTLTWADLLAPHNVHRIVLTRVEALLLLAANGQWDAQLQMVVNAGIQAAATMVLVWVLWTLCERRHLADIGALACLVFATPIAWENTLAGFQSQFYFLNLTAIVGLWAVAFVPPLSVRWMVGIVVLVLGLFTMASGVVAPVAAALVVVLHHAGVRRLGRETVISVGACLGVAVVGWLLLPFQPEELPNRAQALAPFVDYLTRSLAWPFVDNGWMAGVMWAPSVLLATRMIWTREYRPVHAYSAGLAAWVVAHAVSAAVAQGRDGGAPAWRYMDILAIAPILNATALALLLDDARPPRPLRLATLGAAIVWTVLLVVRVEALSRRVLEVEAPVRHAWSTAYTLNIRQLSADHDIERFSRLHFPNEVPWPDARGLAQDWLRHPALREVLPASIRDPIEVDAASPTAFVTPGTAPGTPPLLHGNSLGSYGDRAEALEGEFRSQSIQCTVGAWLRFDVSGYLGRPGTSLAVEPANGDPPRAVHAGEDAGERWRPAFVRCPDGPFQVVARDASPTTWFAFAPPVEVGPLSRWAERAAASGRGVLVSGLLLAAAGALAVRRTDPQTRQPRLGPRAPRG